MRPAIRRTLFAAIVALSPLNALAITHTWNGGNSFGPDSMNNGLNWSGGVPVSGSSALTLIFPGSPNSNNPNQNIASPLSLQALNVLSGGSYSFVGNAYRFDNLGANPTISIAASTSVQVFNSVTFNAPTTITNNASSNWLGIFSGNGPVTLNANQQMNILGSGPTGYTGTFTVNNGTLVLQRNGTFTNGDIQTNGGAIQCMIANQFGPNTDYIGNGGGLVLFSGNQSLRDITMNSNAFMSFVSNNTLFLNGNVTGGVGGSGIGNNNGDTIDLGGNNTIFNITTAGAANAMNINASITNGTYVKSGAGTLSIFSISNAFTGTNLIAAGTVRGAPQSIGTVINNGTISFGGGGVMNSNTISGSGNVIIEGGVFIQLNAAQSYTGGTDLGVGASINANAATLTGNYNAIGGPGSGVIEVNQTSPGTLTATFSGGIQLQKTGGSILTIGGVNTHSGNNIIEQGVLAVASDTALGTGPILLGIGFSAGIEAVGTRTIANPLIIGPGFLSIIGTGNLNLTNTGDKSLATTLTHTSTGSTQIAGKFSTTTNSVINVNAGNLTLGDSGVVGGFIAAGQISISSGASLTLKSLNFISLPDVSLAGGTLNTPNGYAIPLGAALQGSGSVSGRVASANGSSIFATGNLALGDIVNVAGVNLDGELYTNANTVTLFDANQAVLGSLTRVGTASNDGTLVASRGVVVNFGRNITGRGQVQSINNLANAVVMNGDASGDSLTNYLEFTGYVKGVGSFNNVAFSGTFSPGLSPTLLTVGSLLLTPSNVLDMELGGLVRGGQYDAFDINGTMVLNGQLKLSFINAFTPVAGNQFDLFNGTTVSTFSSFNFAPLPAGLVWDTSLLYSQGIVQVVLVPEPTSLALLAGMSLLGRRRR